MSTIAIVEHRGRTIIQTRFPRGTDLNGIRTILSETSFVYAQLPAGGILAMIDFDQQVLDQTQINLIEAVAKVNAQNVKATALLGVAPVQRELFLSLLAQMRRTGRLFETEAEALDWLSSLA